MERSTSKGLNILVVDDERPVTTSIKAALKKSGNSVDALHDGLDALVRFAEMPDHYHILITDHFMYEVSGLELVEKVRKNGFRGRVVVLSGFLKLDLEKAYLAAGADRIIRKPFDLDELRRAVEDLKP